MTSPQIKKPLISLCSILLQKQIKIGAADLVKAKKLRDACQKNPVPKTTWALVNCFSRLISKIVLMSNVVLTNDLWDCGHTHCISTHSLQHPHFSYGLETGPRQECVHAIYNTNTHERK